MQRLTSILRLVAGFLFLALVSTIMFVAELALLPFGRVARIRLGNLAGKVIGRGILAIGGIRPEVRGRERLRASFPAIYVMNHVSALDAFAGMWLCPFGGCGVAKREIVRVPFFGQLYWLSGHLMIDRGDRGSAVAALSRTAALMRRHRLGAWMWPEGTRSEDGRLKPALKKGFAHLAIATGLPVVPVVVHDAHKAWRKHGYTFTPMTLRIDVLPPVDTRSWRAETVDAHCAEVHRIFAEHLQPHQRPPGWEDGEAVRRASA